MSADPRQLELFPQEPAAIVFPLVEWLHKLAAISGECSELLVNLVRKQEANRQWNDLARERDELKRQLSTIYLDRPLTITGIQELIDKIKELQRQSNGPDEITRLKRQLETMDCGHRRCEWVEERNPLIINEQDSGFTSVTGYCRQCRREAELKQALKWALGLLGDDFGPSLSDWLRCTFCHSTWRTKEYHSHDCPYAAARAALEKL